MSIAKKLGLAISPLVVLSICLVIFSYQSMKQVQEQIPNISEFAVTSTELVHNANTAFDRQVRFYEDVVFMHDLDMLEKADESYREIRNHLEKLQSLKGISSRTQTAVDNFLKKLENYTTTAGKTYRQMTEDENYLNITENAQIVNNLGEEKNNLETVLRGFSGIVRNELAQKIVTVNMSAKTKNNINAAISSVIIGISVLIIFFLIERSVTRPMVEANQKLQKAMDSLWGEMELAKKIQTCLMPEKPEISGYEIAASCEPSEQVGGDYYDIISVGGYDWIVIGDVSGHGVTAGLVMMMVQTAIHTVLNNNPETEPSRLLSVINKVIYSNIELMGESKHMTIIVLAAGKEGRFSFSGLHEDILIRRAKTGKVEVVESGGMWIGLEPDISRYLSDDTLKMEPGDCMILFTDGITEAYCEEGKLFGDDRLIRVIEESGEKSAAEIRESIIGELESCKKPDDVTLVVMKMI